MTIKPVLVPDHDAADLRKLMDHFAEATTGPTRQQLAESRAAVAAAQGVAEGFNEDILDKLKKSWDWLSFKDEREGKQETGEEWAARYMKDLEGQRQDEREGKPIRRNRAKDEMMAKTFSDRDERDVDEGVAEGSVARYDLYNVVIEYFNGGKGHRNAMALRKKAESGMSAKNLAVLLNDFSKKKWGSTLNGSDAIDAVKNIVYPYDFEQGVAEGKKRSDRYHIVGKDGNPASLASYADQVSAVKDRDKKHPGAEVRQVGPRGKIKGVSEGFMDTVKQAFNDAVVGHPMGTSDEQFIQGWARAIQAETGRDIPLEKLTQLYQDYVERSDELMQSHGTTNEESAESLAEFAPSDSGDGGGDDDGFDEDTLRKLAAQWFNGDEDPQVERLLAAAGWEIGQDEGYDDEPGVFVVMSGDDDGRSYISWPAEELRSDVAEARPDVMRHKGDTTVKVVKRAGKPIGEIGIDAEASAGNGAYYVKLYDGSYDAVGFDSAEEALAELKYAVKQMSEGVAEASPTGVFKQGDKVKVHGKYNGTVVGQDGDTYYVQIDGQPGSQAVSAASLANPAAGGFKPGAKLMYKGQPVTYIRPFAQDPGQSYVKIASGSDELVATADLQAATVAESIDPVEQLRADIRRFAL